MTGLTLRQICTETLRAALVLALLFLSFAHVQTANAAGPDVLAAETLDMNWCGDLPDDPRAHAPCHACRIGGGADLPPPADLALPARLVATANWGAMPVLLPPAAPIHRLHARGPPAA